MARALLSTLLLTVLATGCKVGDGDFGDGGLADDAGHPLHDAGGHGERDGAGPELDAGTPDAATEPDAGQPDAGSGEVPAIDELADALAEGSCEALADCVGHADLLADLLGGHDCADVTAGDLRNGELSYLPASIAAGRVVYDPSEQEACAADLAALGCDVRSRRWPASCELMVLGTVVLGGDCDLDHECAGDAYCDTAGACPGTCKARLSAGSECTDSDDDQCEDGLVCARATGSCVALGDNGEDCGAGLPPCAPGYVCHDGGGGASCTSVAVLYFRAQDEACSPGSGACDPGVFVCGDVELCEPGLVCESASSGGVCRPPSSRDGACKRAVPNQCPLDQVCDAALPGDTGSCVDRPADGETCLSRAPSCAPGHVCLGDTCAARLDNGEACADDAECRGGRCEGSRCAGSAACGG